MAQPITLPLRDVLFPYEKWNPLASSLTKEYKSNQPFPHIRLEEFLDPEVAASVAQEFPATGTQAWTQYKHHNENKLGRAKRELFPPRLGAVADELNSAEFVAWLSVVTGIPALRPDTSLEGGGLH